MNLRTRFALIAGALVFVLATVMSVGAYRIASSQLENQVQTSLEQRISRILNIMDRPNFTWQDSFGPGPVNQAIMQTEVDAITQVVLPMVKYLDAANTRNFPSRVLTKHSLSVVTV